MTLINQNHFGKSLGTTSPPQANAIGFLPRRLLHHRRKNAPSHRLTTVRGFHEHAIRVNHCPSNGVFKQTATSGEKSHLKVSSRKLGLRRLRMSCTQTSGPSKKLTRAGCIGCGSLALVPPHIQPRKLLALLGNVPLCSLPRKIPCSINATRHPS